jgi:hypothetical protein
MSCLPFWIKVLRAVVGATWSLPFRYITFGGQLAALALVPGVVLHVPTGWAVVAAMTAGVLVGWGMRVLDNLINEFLVFEWIKRKFLSSKKDLKNDTRP